MTYIQSVNVLLTPPSAGGSTAGGAGAAALAAELKQATAAGLGVRARAVVLSHEELARCVPDNPYPGQIDPRLLHAAFLPEAPGPSLAAWLAGAERQLRAKGSRDQARCAAAPSTCTPQAGTRATNCAANAMCSAG